MGMHVLKKYCGLQTGSVIMESIPTDARMTERGKNSHLFHQSESFSEEKVHKHASGYACVWTENTTAPLATICLT